jgi:hypothetical protein
MQNRTLPFTFNFSSSLPLPVQAQTYRALSAVAMSAHSTPKRVRLSEASTDVNIDSLILSVADADVKYCVTVLSGNSELAAFCASMLRDRQLQKALDRKKQSSMQVKLGKVLPDRCKKFRALPKKLCLNALMSITGDKLFDDDAADAKGEGDSFVVDQKSLTRLLAYACKVTADTELPKTHQFNKHEGPTMCVLLARASQVDAAQRLQGLNNANFYEFGNYAPYALDVTKVVCKFADDKLITFVRQSVGSSSLVQSLRAKARSVAWKRPADAKSLDSSNSKRLRLQYLMATRAAFLADEWAHPVLDATRLGGKDWLCIANYSVRSGLAAWMPPQAGTNAK